MKASRQNRVHFVGNVMIDSLFAALPKSVTAVEVLERAGIDPRIARSPPAMAW